MQVDRPKQAGPRGVMAKQSGLIGEVQRVRDPTSKQ